MVLQPWLTSSPWQIGGPALVQGCSLTNFSPVTSSAFHRRGALATPPCPAPCVAECMLGNHPTACWKVCHGPPRAFSSPHAAASVAAHSLPLLHPYVPPSVRLTWLCISSNGFGKENWRSSSTTIRVGRALNNTNYSTDNTRCGNWVRISFDSLSSGQ